MPLVSAVIQQLMGGLRSSMGCLGCATIDEMLEREKFFEITSAGICESRVYDVQIAKLSRKLIDSVFHGAAPVVAFVHSRFENGPPENSHS